ncbi:uncharacterized protein DUF3558 [Nocardia tenerifensis]|uniref:Uncharacterized protein DUF3558 n=1 Tax=Nocardia tenerifensis TaxID=228006 RepID=A0A318KFD6_9NOCA|nr:DUF3558 family protein [Nocardia tenerifensis]PXX70952.1 uncharacterized protein DUF3558 [Nocardia tenerifensis]
MTSNVKSKAVLVGVVGAALVLSGCSTDKDKDTGAVTPTGAVTVSAAATTSATNSGGAQQESAPGPEQSVPAPQAPAPAPTTAESRPSTSVMWNPCGIADADIAHQGLRPESKQIVDSSDGQPGCRWNSATDAFEVTIFSTHQSLQDFKQTGRYTDFAPVHVAGHDATRYRAAQDTNKIGCYVSFPVAGGQTVFVTRNLEPEALEPCGVTLRVVDGLTSYLN